MKTYSNLTVVIAVTLALGLAGCDGGGDGEGMDDVPEMSEDVAEMDTVEGMDTMEPEATRFRVLVENVSVVYPFLKSGVFDTPVGADEPGPLMPMNAYEASFTAGPGMSLSFVTMFVPSNDLFYAPAPEGIALYDGDGMPVSGDVTDQIHLWDAGTEVNQEPGAGADQPLNGGGESGEDEMGVVQKIGMVDDGFMYPMTADVLKVTLTPGDAGSFILRIENVSEVGDIVPSMGDPLPVPLTPGVFVVHGGAAPLFSMGEADLGMGLEQIAEAGDPSVLAPNLAAKSGLTSPLAPGAYAIHAGANPLFTLEAADMGEGLEPLAEDGDPGALAAALAARDDVATAGAFAIPVDGMDPAPAFPGEAYAFELEAVPGDLLSLATMYVQSNDLFYANGADGIALFDGDGMAKAGDMTMKLELFDAGTEVNEEPGVGKHQAPRQMGPDSGMDEGGVVAPVDDGFMYPATDAVIRLSIEIL